MVPVAGTIFSGSGVATTTFSTVTVWVTGTSFTTSFTTSSFTTFSTVTVWITGTSFTTSLVPPPQAAVRRAIKPTTTSSNQ